MQTKTSHPINMVTLTSKCHADHVVLFMFSDLPRVLNMPVRIFLPRNMEGHIKCSVEANPPFTLIVWTKNERIIDFTHTSRLKLNKDGTLVINDVDDNDEGRYTCTPYSPLGAGRSSSVVQIHVRGQHSFYFYAVCLSLRTKYY